MAYLKLDTSLNSYFNATSVLDFKFTNLLSFLQQYKASYLNLQMTYLYINIPLPSIDINLEPTLRLNIKVKFSLQLSEALLQYILALRTTAVKVLNKRTIKQPISFTRPYNNDNKTSTLIQTYNHIPYQVTKDFNSPTGAIFLDKDYINQQVHYFKVYTNCLGVYNKIHSRLNSIQQKYIPTSLVIILLIIQPYS